MFGLLIIPAASTNFSKPESMEYWEHIGSSSNPDSAWYCDVSIENSVWWHDYNQTVTFNIRAEFNVGKVGIQKVNLTRVILRLYLGSKYIPLFSYNYTPEVSIPNVTSYSSSLLKYELEFKQEVTISGYEFIHYSRGPKIEGNLVFAVFLNTEGHTILLSNYYDPGVTGWTPTDFPVIIDNSLSRSESILSIWSLTLIPGFIYCLGRFSKKKSNENVFKKLYDSQENRLYFLSLALFGIFTCVLFSIDYGSIIYYLVPNWKFWFASVVVLFGGLSLSFIVPGIANELSIGEGFENQYYRYGEIATLTGNQYRTSEELDESWVSWNPEDYDPHYYRQASSIFEWIFLLLITIACMATIYPRSSATFLHTISVFLFGICLFSLIHSVISRMILNQNYNNWRESWISYWKSLYTLIAPTELLLQWLNPIGLLRREIPSTLSDYELLRNELEPGSTTVITRNQIPEAISIASLVWYYRTRLVPKISKIDNSQLKSKLEETLRPFATMSSVWSHPNGLEFLLKRAAFVEYSIVLSTWAPILAIDNCQLLLNTSLWNNVHSQQSISRISDFFSDSMRIPTSHKIPSMRSLLTFRFMWIFISLLLAFPISEIIWNYI